MQRQTEPIAKLYRQLNKITADGGNITHFSPRLGDTINSIIEVKKHSDIDNFLSGNAISLVTDSIKSLDGFELICFFSEH